MKKIFILLNILCLYSITHAEIINLHFSQGHKSYLITKAQKMQVKERLNQVSAKYMVKETFLFRDKIGEHLVWEYANIRLDDPSGRFNPVFEAVKSLYEGLEIKFYINNDYEFVLENYEKLAKVAKQTIQIVVNEIKRKTSDQKVIEAVQKQLSSIYSNENYLRNKLPQEAILFYSIYGLDFQNSNTLEYGTQMPTPFSGLTLPANGKYILHKDKGKIEWIQAIDPEASREYLKKFFSQLPKEKNLNNQIRDINISDKAVFKLDKNLTQIIEINQTRKISLGEAKRADISVIKRTH